MTHPVDPYERLAAVDPLAGSWVASLRASIDSTPGHRARPTNGQRGWLVSELDKACGSTDFRHAFLWAVTGEPSSKQWTLAHYTALRNWLKREGDDLAPRIALSALEAQVDDVYLAALEKQPPTELAKAKGDTMSINMAALVKRASDDYGYHGAGDVLDALGVEDIEQFDGDVTAALTILREKAIDTAAKTPDANTDTENDVASIEAMAYEAKEEIERQLDKVEFDPDVMARYVQQCAAMPESPILAWTKVQRRPGGPVTTWSFRAGLDPETFALGLQIMAKATLAFEVWLYNIGGSAVIDGRDSVAFNRHTEAPASNPPTRQAAAPPPTAPAPPTAPQTPPTAPPTADGVSDIDEVETFPVTSIERDVTSKGDNMYKLRGGKYGKFGVTGYEEAESAINALLEAAGEDFRIGNLAIKQEWNVSAYGWTAHASKPAGEKYAKKVFDVVA